jgi:hypothetical protein
MKTDMNFMPLEATSPPYILISINNSNMAAVRTCVLEATLAAKSS